MVRHREIARRADGERAWDGKVSMPRRWVRWLRRQHYLGIGGQVLQRSWAPRTPIGSDIAVGAPEEGNVDCRRQICRIQDKPELGQLWFGRGAIRLKMGCEQYSTETCGLRLQVSRQASSVWGNSVRLFDEDVRSPARPGIHSRVRLHARPPGYRPGPHHLLGPELPGTVTVVAPGEPFGPVGGMRIDWDALPELSRHERTRVPAMENRQSPGIEREGVAGHRDITRLLGQTLEPGQEIGSSQPAVFMVKGSFLPKQTGQMEGLTVHHRGPTLVAITACIADHQPSERRPTHGIQRVRGEEHQMSTS